MENVYKKLSELRKSILSTWQWCPEWNVMKLISWEDLQDQGGFSDTPEFKQIKRMINGAILANRNPLNSSEFNLRPRAVDPNTGRKLYKRAGVTVNGVVPIKDGFINELRAQGWEFEQRTHPRLGACDAVFSFNNGTKPFIVEWETGNISSSHRAANRILVSILEGYASGGVIILPSKAMYEHLTDRIGNLYEMEPYFGLYKNIDNLSLEPYFFGFVVVEHDKLSSDVPYLAGGNDGLARKFLSKS